MYTLCEDGAAEDDGDGGDDAVPSFREWELPSAAFHQVPWLTATTASSHASAQDGVSLDA